MSIFCNQCQQTAKGTGCETRGVCGKAEETAKLQDLLIYVLKGISFIVTKGILDVKELDEINRELLTSLYMTITNTNFDDVAFVLQINKMIVLRDILRNKVSIEDYHDSAVFKIISKEDMLNKATSVGVLSTENEDIRSLRQLIICGLKGMAAFAELAVNYGKKNYDIFNFIYHALAAIIDDNLSLEELIKLTLKTGQYGVNVMALLDKATAGKYGNPQITKVYIGVRNNPAILISGHSLTDLEQLLEQTKGTGIDIYTHCEMLPAHYYPAFKKYDNLVGNYGNAWWKQADEFKTFGGPILLTSNCIVPPKGEKIRNRIYTTGVAGYPGCVHIAADEDGKKDFSQIIKMAIKLPPPKGIENGKITGGFAHSQIITLEDKLFEAVESGAIKKFFIMAGCDGRGTSREYYTEFVKKLPKDTIILTAGCAKYRFNKLDLGEISGIPRVLDAGQCNDIYSLAVTALKLKEIFELDDVNHLPIVFNIAWFGQHSVIVLLALLYLGFRNIHLGPTLPTFLSDNIAKILIKAFGISAIGTVDDDITKFMKS